MNIPYRGSDGPLHLLIDSTGIKVEGEGGWMVLRGASFGTKRDWLWQGNFFHCMSGFARW